MKCLILAAAMLFACLDMSAQERAREGRLQMDMRIVGDEFFTFDVMSDNEFGKLPPYCNLACGIGYRINDFYYIGIGAGLSELIDIYTPKDSKYRVTPVYGDFAFYIPWNVLEENKRYFYMGCMAGMKFMKSLQSPKYSYPVGAGASSKKYSDYSMIFLKVKAGVNVQITDHLSLDAEADYGILGLGFSAGLVFQL